MLPSESFHPGLNQRKDAKAQNPTSAEGYRLIMVSIKAEVTLKRFPIGSVAVLADAVDPMLPELSITKKIDGVSGMMETGTVLGRPPSFAAAATSPEIFPAAKKAIPSIIATVNR